MLLASLTFAGWSWLAPAALALVGASVVVAWSYGRGPSSGVRWLGAALKLLGVAALLFCLLEPLWSGQRARPGANLFALVADNSQSQQVKDAGAAHTRGDGLRGLLAPVPGGWQSRLAEDFDLRRYAFATRLENISDFGKLDFEGRSTGIGSALRSLGERFRNRPLAGILLFTDGNATDLPRGVPDLKDLPPVYPVVIGERSATRDLAVAQVNVTQSSFEDAPVAVQAEVTADGLRGERVALQVVDQAGKVVKEESQTARRDHESLPVRLQFKPEKPGVSFYQFRALRRAEARGATNASDEATLINNARVIAVDRGRGPYRILYVSGRPNWEYKFLHRAAQEDPQLDLVALIRVARREPKFEFRGRAGETSNPLFRGFGDQSPEQVERFDQPVLIALNTRDELELKKGFPATAADLFAYHAVIIDDLESAFFTPEQATLLQRFVSERGGGLLMLGGTECFREGGYYRTPIGDALPVYLDRAFEYPPGPLRFSLSREGWLQPWARLRDNEAAERQRLDGMTEFNVANRVRGHKPGASVLATVKDTGGKEFPALVTQRFGRGRSAALLLGDLWRWGLHDPAAHADMDKLWRQTLRWLVTDTPGKVELAVEPVPTDAAGAVQLEVRVRDPQYQPLDNVAVTIEVEPVAFRAFLTNAVSPPSTPSTQSTQSTRIHLRAEPSPSEAGLYRATFVPRLSGGYRATAVVTNTSGTEHGRAEAGWSSDLAVEEFRSLVPNVALLEGIARATGGEVVKPADLEAFARRLPQKHAPVMEAWAEPLWHTPYFFAFALLCLAAEWGLRRWKGMP